MTMGIALRDIGSSPVVVLLRVKTGEIKNTVVPVNPKKENDGVKVVSLMGEDPIRIRATGFRELGEGSDVWEFRVLEQNQESRMEINTLWYVKGEDILVIMAIAKVNI